MTDTKALGVVDVYGRPFTTGWRQANPDTGTLIKQYKGTVYSVAKLIADKITATDCRLYTTKRTTTKAKGLGHNVKRVMSVARKYVSGDDVTEVTTSEALDLLRRPNPLMTGRQLLTYTQLYLDIAGICYWHLASDENSTTPHAIFILPPHCVQVNRDYRTGRALSYRFGEDVIPAEQVLVITSENLDNPLGDKPGTSSVKAVFDTLGLQDRITSTLIAILDNEGRPSGILSPKDENSSLTEESAERMLQRYNRMLRSGSGSVMVLDEAMGFTPLNYKPTDLAALELHKRAEEVICVAFQVPVMLLRGIEGGSRAAYQTALQQWADGGLSSRLRDLEEFLNYQYLPRFEDSETAFFCFDDPSPDIAELNQQIVTGYVNADLWTINEGRAYLGYPPLDGGDVVKSQYVGASGLPADLGAEAPAQQPAEVVETEQEIQTLPSNTLNGAQIDSALSIVSQVATGLLPRESGLGALQILLNLTPEQAATIMGPVGSTFFAPVAAEPGPETGKALIVPADLGTDTKAARRGPSKIPQGKELLPILRKHFRKWAASVEGSIAKAASTIATKGLPDKFVPVGKWAKDLAEDSQPVIEIFFRDEGRKLLQRVGASPDVFDVFNSHVKKRAETVALDLAQSTLDTTTKEINEALDATREAMAEGLEAGESIDKIKKRIGEIFENAEGYRAERIAATEAARAHHEGLRDAAVESGVVKGFEWITSSDPCPYCQDLNGKAIKLDGDLPPLHPNCQCAVLEIVE